MIKYNRHLKFYSKQLRSNMTDSEQQLWQSIRKKQVLNIQFYRQKPIANFILHFYAPKIKLAIEIDGDQHFDNINNYMDLQRDQQLSNLGIDVLRYNNLQVLHEINSVLDDIYQVC